MGGAGGLGAAPFDPMVFPDPAPDLERIRTLAALNTVLAEASTMRPRKVSAPCFMFRVG